MGAVSPKAKKRLRRLAEVIKKNHKHFDMQSWCGSKGCIAGFAIVEFDKKVFPSYAKGLKDINECSNDEHSREEAISVISAAAKRFGFDLAGFGYVTWATKLLDIGKEQRGRLFLESDWPHEFERRYDDALTSKDRAKAAADRLLHMAKTGE